MERYQSAVQSLTERGCLPISQQLERALASSRPVISRSIGEVLRLATSEQELYATYYQLAMGQVRIPKGDRWDVLRRVADSALFPGYASEIHFAALSLDGQGLANWGECSMTLREHMVAHRVTVLEENSVTFLKRHYIRAAELDSLPRGYRASWNDRHHLVIAKLSSSINSSTTCDDFVGLLMSQGDNTSEDEFLEIHCFGPISIRTVERVVVLRRNETISDATLDALREHLRRVSVSLEVR
jgi:hypothetical protein